MDIDHDFIVLYDNDKTTCVVCKTVWEASQVAEKMARNKPKLRVNTYKLLASITANLVIEEAKVI